MARYECGLQYKTVALMNEMAQAASAPYLQQNADRTNFGLRARN